jgi:hypothetical protein
MGYVAAANFVSRDIDKRWRDTFGFGMIHGFGFASALQEFGLPRNALIPRPCLVQSRRRDRTDRHRLPLLFRVCWEWIA